MKQLEDFPAGVKRIGGRMLLRECEGRVFSPSSGLGGIKSCGCGTANRAQIPFGDPTRYATVCGVCDHAFQFPRVRQG